MPLKPSPLGSPYLNTVDSYGLRASSSGPWSGVKFAGGD